jgi:hypothetical protein
VAGSFWTLHVDPRLTAIDAGERPGADTEDEAEDHPAEDQVPVVAGRRDSLEIRKQEVDHDHHRQSQVARSEAAPPELEEHSRHQDGVEDVVEGVHGGPAPFSSRAR